MGESSTTRLSWNITSPINSKQPLARSFQRWMVFCHLETWFSVAESVEEHGQVLAPLTSTPGNDVDFSLFIAATAVRFLATLSMHDL